MDEYIRIAITKTDGTLDQYTLQTWALDIAGIDQWIAKTFAGKKIKPASWRIVPNEQVIDEHHPFIAYRDAYRDTGKAEYEIDMPHARELHRNILREQRAPLLAELDTQYQIADEKGDNAAKKAVAAQKQVLRDITTDPRIEAATTPAELKLITLVE